MSPKQTPQAAPARRRILIIDDHPLVRRGLRALIDADSDLIVCAEAADPRAGLEAIACARPDLAVVELSFQAAEGLALVRAICAMQDGPPVLVLTTHDAQLYAEPAFAAGARGYVTKREITETLLLAIRSVLCGGTYGVPGS
jgi:DNA-binding NarL/FixJ family response regulator